MRPPLPPVLGPPAGRPSGHTPKRPATSHRIVALTSAVLIPGGSPDAVPAVQKCGPCEATLARCLALADGRRAVAATFWQHTVGRMQRRRGASPDCGVSGRAGVEALDSARGLSKGLRVQGLGQGHVAALASTQAVLARMTRQAGRRHGTLPHLLQQPAMCTFHRAHVRRAASHACNAPLVHGGDEG